MAENREDRGGERPTTRAPDRSTFFGIGATAVAAVFAIVLLLVLFGAFEGEEDTVMEETDNTMMGGAVTGAGIDENEDETGAVVE